MGATSCQKVTAPVVFWLLLSSPHATIPVASTPMVRTALEARMITSLYSLRGNRRRRFTDGCPLCSTSQSTTDAATFPGLTDTLVPSRTKDNTSARAKCHQRSKFDDAKSTKLVREETRWRRPRPALWCRAQGGRDDGNFQSDGDLDGESQGGQGHRERRRGTLRRPLHLRHPLRGSQGRYHARGADRRGTGRLLLDVPGGSAVDRGLRADADRHIGDGPPGRGPADREDRARHDRQGAGHRPQALRRQGRLLEGELPGVEGAGLGADDHAQGAPGVAAGRE